eukprot:7903728-Heterocapsa_arctica.AAC.1
MVQMACQAMLRAAAAHRLTVRACAIRGGCAGPTEGPRGEAPELGRAKYAAGGTPSLEFDRRCEARRGISEWAMSGG